MINLLTNAVAFVFALGVIIFIHELGHLLVAKYFRVPARVFSLGFGKRLWGFERGGTDYRVALVPLGGYVQLTGEDPTEVSDNPLEFLNRPRWQRVLIYLAGPAMNVILAILLVAVVFMLGIEVAAPPDIRAVVGSVRPDGAAAVAGLQPGDEIVEIDGRAISRWDEARFAIMTAPERDLSVRYLRGEQSLETTITPEKVPRYEFGDAGIFPSVLPRVVGLLEGAPADVAGFLPGDEIRAVDGRPMAGQADLIAYLSANPERELRVEVLRGGEPLLLTVVPALEDGRGRIGVTLSATAFQRYGPAESLIQSVRFNWDVTQQTFRVLGKIFTGKLAAKSALSGPIEIAALSGAAARSGFRNLLHLMGLISISIAILNLLPIPVLDGGQIALLLIESIFRRDLSLKLKERINQVGFVLIVMLMVVVLYFDVIKNVPESFLSGS